MSDNTRHRCYRARWPEKQILAGSPVWLHYEVDKGANAVLRTVEVFPNGQVNRNSIELERRYGDYCPSLIDCSLDGLFDSAGFDQITREQFEELWLKGTDSPFWFVR